MHGATHAGVWNPVSVESGLTGDTNRDDSLAMSLGKAPFTRQEARHCWPNLDRDRSSPVDMAKVSWLLLHIANRARRYLHGALVVKGFQEGLDGINFTFGRNRVAPVTANRGRFFLLEGSLRSLDQLI
jgi:hypothetical protein